MTPHKPLPPSPPPSAWVCRFAPLIAKTGPVLDLACGSGRHARHLMDRGHKVVAVDKDVTQAVYAQGATLIAADLENGAPWPLEGQTFAGIVVTHYLWRPLFSAIRQALAPGGVLIYETFAQGNQAIGRPRNPDFLLKRGELLTLAHDLTIVAYEDLLTDQPAFMQRIAAVNGPHPQWAG